MATIKTGVKLTKNGLPDLMAKLEALTRQRVLVGFPADDQNSLRKEDTAITNASLAYIHDNGAPEANIPARPFMREGIRAAETSIANQLWSTAKKVVKPEGTTAEIDAGLSATGIRAVNGIRARINEGIPPPLSDRTIAARAARGRKGALWEQAWRAAGAPAGTDLAKPLIDTGQLRNAVTYVIRKK